MRGTGEGRERFLRFLCPYHLVVSSVTSSLRDTPQPVSSTADVIWRGEGKQCPGTAALRPHPFW